MRVLDAINQEISKVLAATDESQLDDAVPLFTKQRRIFVLGAGRSGLMTKAFAMRLMHIGYTPFVIGETITPSVQKGDLLLVVSGSGTTHSIVELAEKAHQQGVTLLALTCNGQSPLAKLADKKIVVPGATKNGDGIKSIQLLSTLFDQSVHLVLDALCLKLARRDGTDNGAAKSRHSNME
ncbi:MAG TPA: 6-phospho-3-hexuloisomerase [Candidatus Limosilactobacillus merdigallinarum]|uniref:6-phospho-3-hexuloisomerase n=1 Tax=Candidatus Limosilactobacillus merdigallinarum TaxID=2838652 RepID=A0A9D1VHC0_9LACO|nr:6-phospho-3-hexuloisomerase [Candidatus Limosilactobacillus merdigallinarum]